LILGISLGLVYGWWMVDGAFQRLGDECGKANFINNSPQTMLSMGGNYRAQMVGLWWFLIGDS